MTRIEQLKQVFVPGKTIDFFTADSETIFGIDIESDAIEYFVSVSSAATADCGCCGENEFREDSSAATITHFLEFMSEDDFQDLLKHLTE